MSARGQPLLPGTTADAAERAGWLESWVGLIRRRWRAGLIVAGVLFALAATVVLTATPTYRAQARFRLGEPPPMSGVSPTANVFGLMRLGGDPFANDMELLDSRTLVEGVIRDASLNVSLKAPRGWLRDSLFTRLTADTSTILSSFAIDWRVDGDIDVRQLTPRDTLIATTSPGEPVTFHGVTAAMRAWREGMPREVALRTAPLSLAVMEIRPRIIVERSRRDANVVDLSYDGPDPAILVEALDAVIERFIALRTTIARRESGETVDSLRVVADSTMRELRAAEAALESWQRQTLLVQPEIQGEAFVGRYSEIALQAERARYELDAIVSIARQVEATPDSLMDWTVLLTHPSFLANETIGAVLAQLAQLENTRAELLTRRAVTSREVSIVDKQRRDLDARLRSLVTGYQATLAAQLEALQGELDEMSASLAATPGQTIELGRRQRAIRLLSEIILLTETRLRQEELRQALTFSNVQVIDPPALRFKPVWPRKKLGLAVGMMFSGLFGLLAMVVAERADRTVRRAVQIEEVTGAPILAVTLANQGRAPALSEREVHAMARLRAGEQNGNSTVGLATIGRDDRTVAVVRALAGGNGFIQPMQDHASHEHRVVALPPVDDFAAAAAAEGGPVALVVHLGRTRRDELARSVRLLHAAGATIVGAIVVCDRERQASTLWT
jgi:uncharacterized protein involved in exopolysaccharide biosynthesis